MVAKRPAGSSPPRMSPQTVDQTQVNHAVAQSHPHMIETRTYGSQIPGAPYKTDSELWDKETGVPAVNEMTDGAITLSQELELEIATVESLRKDEVFEFEDVDKYTPAEIRNKKEKLGIVTNDEPHSALYHGQHRRTQKAEQRAQKRKKEIKEKKVEH